MGNCGSARKGASGGPSGSVKVTGSSHEDTPDLFAIYLRPRRLQRKAEVVSTMEFNRRWGGIHITLCSFAPPYATEANARTPPHGCDLDSAMTSLHMAGQPKTLSSFKIDKSAKLPLVHSKSHPGIAMLKMPADHVGLRAICNAASAAGLRNARKVEDMHVTVGDELNVDGVREALWACEYWELALAKSSGKEREIRVTGFVEVKPLTWDGSSKPSSRLSGSGASKKSATSRSGRRYHVYAPSLPSEYHGD